MAKLTKDAIAKILNSLLTTDKAPGYFERVHNAVGQLAEEDRLAVAEALRVRKEQNNDPKQAGKISTLLTVVQAVEHVAEAVEVADQFFKTEEDENKRGGSKRGFVLDILKSINGGRSYDDALEAVKRDEKYARKTDDDLIVAAFDDAMVKMAAVIEHRAGDLAHEARNALLMLVAKYDLSNPM